MNGQDIFHPLSILLTPGSFYFAVYLPQHTSSYTRTEIGISYLFLYARAYCSTWPTSERKDIDICRAQFIGWRQTVLSTTVCTSNSCSYVTKFLNSHDKRFDIYLWLWKFLPPSSLSVLLPLFFLFPSHSFHMFSGKMLTFQTFPSFLSIWDYYHKPLCLAKFLMNMPNSPRIHRLKFWKPTTTRNKV